VAFVICEENHEEVDYFLKLQSSNCYVERVLFFDTTIDITQPIVCVAIGP
jgi:hypothetical protein